MKAHRYVLPIALVLFAATAPLAIHGTSPAGAASNTRARATKRSKGVTPKTSYPTVSVYVSANDASATDSGRGSSSQPFRTIQRAVDSAESYNSRGIATHVIVKPGTYREDVQFFPDGSPTAAPIIVQGPAADNAIVSGANVWANWRSTTDGIFWHSSPFNWGPAPIPPNWQNSGVTPIVQRHETLFVNGVLQRQVLTLGALQSGPASEFYVSNNDGTVYLKPPRGVKVNKARVESGVRPIILNVEQQKNVTIRNLRFRGAPTAFGPAAIVDHSTNVLLSNVAFGWNNWTGLAVAHSVNVKIVHSQFNHNGSMGIEGQEDRNLTLEDDQNSYNNWRGAWGGMTLWENGMKFSSVHGAVLDDYVAEGNQAPGLWLDTDNRNITIENSKMEHNGVYGVLLEANQGPITLKNNLVCDNTKSGIVDGRSNHVLVEDNKAFGNHVAQLLFSGSPFVRSATDFQTGVTTQIHSQDWTIRDNTFAGSGGNELLTGAWGIPESVWSIMASTMHSSQNHWIQSGDALPFRIPGDDAPGNMSTWIAASGDKGSTFSTRPSHLTCK